MIDDIKASIVLLVMVSLAFTAGMVVGSYKQRCPPLCPAAGEQ